MKLKEITEPPTPKKLLIVLSDPESQILNEATKATVGNYTARRDQPHFQGDQYHTHVNLPKGYQVAWNMDGSRRHPGKFPVVIPRNAKAAAAKVLGVDENLLETFQWHDDLINEEIYIIEVRDTPGSGEKNLPPGWA